MNEHALLPGRPGLVAGAIVGWLLVGAGLNLQRWLAWAIVAFGRRLGQGPPPDDVLTIVAFGLGVGVFLATGWLAYPRLHARAQAEPWSRALRGLASGGEVRPAVWAALILTPLLLLALALAEVLSTTTLLVGVGVTVAAVDLLFPALVSLLDDARRFRGGQSPVPPASPPLPLPLDPEDDGIYREPEPAAN